MERRALASIESLYWPRDVDFYTWFDQLFPELRRATTQGVLTYLRALTPDLVTSGDQNLEAQRQNIEAALVLYIVAFNNNYESQDISSFEQIVWDAQSANDRDFFQRWSDYYRLHSQEFLSLISLDKGTRNRDSATAISQLLANFE